MTDVRKMNGIPEDQATLHQKQARWNRTQFLALSTQYMKGFLEDLAFSTRHLRQTALDGSEKSPEGVDPLQSRVLELHSMEGLSIRETAQVLETSEENVLSALSLAEEWLGREAWKKAHEDHSSTDRATLS